MKKENCHWFSPSFNNEEKIKLSKLIDTNFLNEGKETKIFEKIISNYLGINYAVSVTSGTSAIFLALVANGIERGDKVIVPNFTFIATANAVRLAGAEPIFVDILSDDLTINVLDIEKVIDSRVKAIIPVDVNGRSCNYEKLILICKKYGLKLISDSAEALGSQHNGKFLGTYGDCGCFSFSAAKSISTGQGGMVVTNSKKIYTRLLELKDQGRRFRGTGGNDHHHAIGFNFKFTDLQASVGIAQFKKLKSRIKNFHKRDLTYRKYLRGLEEIKIPPKRPGEVLQWFDVFVLKKKAGLIRHLKKNKIGFRQFWYPVNFNKPYKCYNIRNLKNSYEVSRSGMWLPSNFDITVSDIKKISLLVKQYYQK